MEETEQTTQVDESQPSGEANPQPTVEELLSKIDEHKAEIERKEKVIEKVTRERDQARSRSVSKDELTAMRQEIGDMREEMAGWLDDVVTRVSGEELQQPQRKSYREQVTAKRTAQPQQMPPDVEDFYYYMRGQGLRLEDDIVQESLNSTNNPKDALTSLKAKVKEKDQAMIDAEVDKKAQEKAQRLAEQKLKEAGVTTAGASAPSSGTGRTFTHAQIAAMDSKEYAENKEAIDKAWREGRIKK